MPTTKQHLIDRELAIEALNVLKSTHTLKEIAAKTSIPLKRLRYYFYTYKNRLIPSILPRTWETTEETKIKISKLIKQGLTIKQAALEMKVNYSTALKYAKNLQPRSIEVALFNQYHRANFEITPLFLIKTHNITQATAVRICNKLKENNG